MSIETKKPRYVYLVLYASGSVYCGFWSLRAARSCVAQMNRGATDDAMTVLRLRVHNP